jgi:DNA invertase Pin-like site-specific DNA recombinase
MKIGYVRISTKEQIFDLQIDSLRKLVVKRFIEKLLVVRRPKGKS